MTEKGPEQHSPLNIILTTLQRKTQLREWLVDWSPEKYKGSFADKLTNKLLVMKARDGTKPK
jgi:hypothetical protein